MTILITSDTHFTNAPRDEHRWGLFSWLRKMARKHDIDNLFLLGDLTDAKDRHPSVLVNRITDEVEETTKECDVVLLRANHDCIDENHPFFRFLSKMKVRYINKPTEFAIGPDKQVALFLPNTRNYQQDWQSLDHLGMLVGGDITRGCDYIFCHQTFDGSLAENGSELRGIPPSFFKGFKGQVISGDVHVPQKVNKQITHVGSPYRVHFGDTFTPRVLLLKNGKFTDLHFPCISREVITIRDVKHLDEGADFPENTQVKIRVKLKRAEYPDWPNIRKEVLRVAKQKGWEVCGLELIELATRVREHEIDVEEFRTPEIVVRDFSKARKLAKELEETGVTFVQEAE